VSGLILGTTARLLVALLLLFSVFVFLRGHDAPGGGFLGGLIAVTGFVLYMLAEGPRAVRSALRVDPRALACTGLFLALASGFAGAATGGPFLDAGWVRVGGTKVGTPFVFDLGVYLVVVGSVLTILFALEEGG
jgi:multicomponent Na+:H+ antiporter subunit B